MKRLFACFLAVMLCLLPYASYAQIWEGSGGSAIDEGLGFGGGSGGGDIDWGEFTGDKCTITFQNYDGTGVQSAIVPVGVPSRYVMSEIEEPTKPGYIFNGWSLIDDYPTPVTIPDNFVATTTYYSIFVKTRYTVYYRDVDNSLYTSQTYEYGDEIVEPTEPTYANDYFWDWDGLPDDMPPATFTVNALVFPKTTEAYGMEVDLDAVSSATAYTYLYDSVGKNPVTISTDGTVNNWDDTSSSWKSFIYQYVEPCMLKLDGTVDYYLDRDNQSLRADGVTASDISNSSYDGNAMVEFRKLWSNAKRIRGTNKYRLIMSPNEINKITFAEAFKRADGTYADKAYYSMFKAGYANSRANSLGGVGTDDNTTNLSTIRARARINGAGWDVTYEALTQHVYKIAFLTGRTVEPIGVLFHKSNIPVRYSSRAPDNRSHGISNGCFYIQGNQNTNGLIKTLWINDLWGSLQYLQTGLCYHETKAKLAYPPFADYGSLDDYFDIMDYSEDTAFMSNSNNLSATRLSFYKGIAYESKCKSSYNSSAGSNAALIGSYWFGFVLQASYRKGNYIMPSYRGNPARLDNASDAVPSVSYHHCGGNSNTTTPNTVTFGYRLSYIGNNTRGKLQSSGFDRKSLLNRLESKDEPKEIATPTQEIIK